MGKVIFLIAVSQYHACNSKHFCCSWVCRTAQASPFRPRGLSSLHLMCPPGKQPPNTSSHCNCKGARRQAVTVRSQALDLALALCLFYAREITNPSQRSRSKDVHSFFFLRRDCKVTLETNNPIYRSLPF